MDRTVHQEQKAVEAESLDTAVILTNGGVFGGSVTQGPTPVGPLTHVGGLSLFLRTVLTLQRAGFTAVVVLAVADEAELKRLLHDDRRVTLVIRWRPAREFPPDDPRTWEALANDVKGVCLVVGAQTVCSRELAERLRREVQDGHTALAVQCDDVTADMAVLPPSLLSVSAATGGHGGVPLRALLEQAQADGRVKTLRVESGSPLWCLSVRSPADAKNVERTLFRSLKGQFEGVVDTHFNRKVSSALSRLFIALGLSPNTITLVSAVIGVFAAAAFAAGSYAGGVAGALLFQLAAIVDCCDGEMARLTFTESSFGEQLDIIADNVVHMAIFAGIGWGSSVAQGGHSAASWLPLALAGSAVLASGISLWLVLRAKAIRERKAWSTPEQAAKAEFILKNMASRDFSVILLLFVLAGKLDWFLWLAAAGSNAFWIMLAWVTRPSSIRA